MISRSGAWAARATSIAQALIAEYDGRVDAIALEGMPTDLRLGAARRLHEMGTQLAIAARRSPIVDGGGVRDLLERWGVTLAARAEPGIFSQKRVLMVPGLNHTGLAEALGRRSLEMRYADPEIFFALPDLPGVGRRWTLRQTDAPTLDQLKYAPFQLITPQPVHPSMPRAAAPFNRADVLAGDIAAIRRYAPDSLRRKIVVVESADERNIEDLRQRGVSVAVTLMPSLEGDGRLGRWTAATIEALLVALRPHPEAPLTEDTYLDLLADLQWRPAIRYLQPEEAGINRFAFVIHPLDVSFIRKHPLFGWTRYLPDVLVIESGEVLIPGTIDFGYDIGLPPGTAYACLAETALLAMEGRFEDYTLGRNITIERVKEIYQLFKKHQFQLAGLRSFGAYLTDEDVAQKRALAERLRGDPVLLEQARAAAAADLARIPAMAKGVRASGSPLIRKLGWPVAAAALAGVLVGICQRR